MSQKNVEAIYPLTPSQHGMLLYLLVSGERTGVFFDQFTVTLEGGLDPLAWRRAWQAVVDRHPALRTLFLWEKRERPLQVVRQTVELPWEELDWRALPAEEQAESFRAYLARDKERGFDLGQAPLLRCALVRVGDDTWRFVWSFSHLVMDGWSIARVSGEVTALYAALAAGREAVLPPARPFRAYLDWLQQKEAASAERFWRESLAGVGDPVPVPLDGTAPPGAPEGSAVRARALAAEQRAALEALARGHRVTLNTLLRGAWALLLARHAGSDEVVYGAVVSGRPHDLEGADAIVGMFVNVLPVRVRIERGKPLGDWLRGLQAQLVEQREVEHCGIEQIHLWAGLPAGTRLFDTLLVFENYPVEPLDPLKTGDAPSLAISDRRLAESNHQALSLYVSFWGGQMTLRFNVHRNRLSEAAADRLLAELVALLGQLAARPDAAVGELAALTAAEAAELVAGGQGGELAAPALPVVERIAAQAARRPQAVAVRGRDGALTYGELVERAGRLARRLAALGVGPESIVAVAAERSPATIVRLLAVLEAGAAYLPLDPGYPADRRAFMLADSGARAVDFDTLDAPAAADAERREDAPARSLGTSATPAYMIYTSGSTGRPKGVAVARGALAHYVAAAVEGFGLSEDDRVLQFASLAFDTSAEEIFPCLAAGGTLVLRSDEMAASLARFAAELSEHGITVLDLPTAFWHELVAEMADGGLTLPACLRLVILGGERAHPDRLAQWRKLAPPGVRILNTYGPTEATIVSTRRDVTEQTSGREVPIGRPIPGARTYVVDRALALSPWGADGELLIGGAGLARGYLARPDLTAERFVPDPFSGLPGERLYRSGDRVRLLPDGDLEFRGRVDAQVKIRGFRVELGEIEAALRSLAAVRDAVVAAREDDGRGLRLVGYVVPAEGGAAKPAELAAALRERLPDYMVPSAFVALEALPKTPSGKVDLRALPAPGHARADGFIPPASQIEEMLAEIWGELLGVPQPGVHDDFFALGGHSLVVTRMVSRVRQAFGVELPIAEVFRRPTIALLAQAVERAERVKGDIPELPPVVRVPRDRPIPLSFPQERVWFLNQVAPGGKLAYNFQVTFWFEGALEVALLRQAFTEIIRRHEALRTTFPLGEAGPVQVIHPPFEAELPVVDLRALPEGLRHAESERLVFAATQVAFDIERLPLLRWQLLRLDDALWELVQVEHHFVHDGWSFSVLQKEMKALYEAFLAGEPSPLAELPVQYADFAVWQRAWMEGPVMDHLLAYWTGKLAGCPTILELPTDRPRPAQPTFAGELSLTLMPPELYEALRAFGRKNGFTLYMSTLAAFYALLARLSGQEDVLLGTGHANRRSKELESLIGMIVNSLVMRGDLRGDPTVLEQLGRVRETTLELYTYQDMPFERLVQELKPDRRIGVNPLFQVMFSFHDAAVPDLEFGGLKGRFRVRGNRTAKVDMNLVVVPRAEQRVGLAASEADRRAVLHWEYNTDLFDAATIDRMRSRYLALLAAMISQGAGGERRLSELPLLTAAEARELLVDANATATDYPRDEALHVRVAAHAARDPRHPAVVCGEASLTYAELVERAESLARRLAGLGVVPGSRVVLLVERSVGSVVASLAALMAGAAYVPLDPHDPVERLRWLVADADASAVVVDDRLPEGLAATRPVLRLADQDGPPGELPTWSDADLPAYVIYTSGSTGRPKGVVVPHRAVVRLVVATNYLEVVPGDRFAHAANPAFDAAVFEVWAALGNGATLVVVPREVALEPARFAAELAARQVNKLFLTTALLGHLLHEAPACLAGREVYFGGEAVDPGAVAGAHRLPVPPARLVNLYGPTEFGVVGTAHETTADGAVPIPIGRPIANSTAYVLDRWRAPVPRGVPGELTLGGDGLAAGYLARPELTAERFVPNPWGPPGSRLYRTGDLVRHGAAGELEFHGRIDGQVKLRGFRVEPGEIEAALAGLPEVAAAAVQVHESEPGVKSLVGYLVFSAAAAPDLPAVRDALRRRLPDYMVPAAFVVLPALPLTGNGKLDRRALPAPTAAVRVAAQEHVAPRTPVEETLAQVWSAMLGVERVGVHDDFFALGGHSLSAIRVLSRVRDAFGVEIPLAVVFEQRTVEALGAAVEARLAAGAEAPAERAAELSDADLDALLGEMISQGVISQGAER